MSLNLTTRQEKGELLTIQEMDDNLKYLEDKGFPYTGSAIVSGSLQVTGSLLTSEDSIFFGNLRTNSNFGINALAHTSNSISVINDVNEGNIINAKNTVSSYGSFINLFTDTHVDSDAESLQNLFSGNNTSQFSINELPVGPQEIGSSLFSNSQGNTEVVSLGVNNSGRPTDAKDGVLYMSHDSSWNIWTNNQKIMYVSSSGVNLLEGDLTIKSSLISNQNNLDVDSGSVDIAQIQTSSYDAAFFDYTIKSGSNSRAGTICSVHNNGKIEYIDNSTNDIGDTTDFVLSVVEENGYITLRSTTNTDNWEVKTLVRGL